MTTLRVPEELTEPGYRDTWRKRSDLPIPPDGAPALVPREPDPTAEALLAGRRYRDLLDARSKALRALRDHGAALDADAEPETAVARFRARAKELRQELGLRLGSSTRGLFERDFDRLAEPMVLAVAQNARTREIAGFKAALEEHQAALRDLAMDESNKALAGEALRQGLYEYERAAQLGVIADAEAGRRSFLDDLQTARDNGEPVQIESREAPQPPTAIPDNAMPAEPVQGVPDVAENDLAANTADQEAFEALFKEIEEKADRSAWDKLMEARKELAGDPDSGELRERYDALRQEMSAALWKRRVLALLARTFPEGRQAMRLLNELAPVPYGISSEAELNEYLNRTHPITPRRAFSPDDRVRRAEDLRDG